MRWAFVLFVFSGCATPPALQRKTEVHNPAAMNHHSWQRRRVSSRYETENCYEMWNESLHKIKVVCE